LFKKLASNWCRQNKIVTSFFKKRFRPQNFRLPRELVFSMGGFGQVPLGTLEVFDIRAKKWTIVKQDVKFPAHAYHGMTVSGATLLIFGGFGDEGLGAGADYYHSVFGFDLLAKTWSKRASMDFPRCYISTAELNGNVYCLGGYNGHVRFNTVECYNVEMNNWSLVKPMQETRSDASAVAHGGRIFIMGGFNGENILHTTEIYDPERNEWTYGPRLNVPRSGLKVKSDWEKRC
jgi:N-acetylneuraminic acid mutarotase